jgi:hypothetical protein
MLNHLAIKTHIGGYQITGISQLSSTTSFAVCTPSPFGEGGERLSMSNPCLLALIPHSIQRGDNIGALLRGGR